MRNLIIGGRSFVLAFNMLTIDKMDEACRKDVDLQTYVTKNFANPKKIPSVLPVVLSANNPDTPDDNWFKTHMTMGQAAAFSKILMDEFIASMAMETENDEDYEKDEVLDEIRKKDRADG